MCPVNFWFEYKLISLPRCALCINSSARQKKCEIFCSCSRMLTSRGRVKIADIQPTRLWKEFREWKLLKNHNNDVIMTTIASQITSLTVVYSTLYSDADQTKHQSSASLAFVRGIHRDRWIPRTKGQLRGKCFHLMTSSCLVKFHCNLFSMVRLIMNKHWLR